MLSEFANMHFVYGIAKIVIIKIEQIYISCKLNEENVIKRLVESNDH